MKLLQKEMKDLKFFEVSIYYEVNSNTKLNQNDSFDFTTTPDYILNSKWL